MADNIPDYISVLVNILSDIAVANGNQSTRHNFCTYLPNNTCMNKVCLRTATFDRFT